MSRTNCVFFAWHLYWRRRSRGKEGYIMLRRSRSGPFPHALYAEVRRTGSVRIVSFKPIAPKEKKLPPPLFRGTSRWGDFVDTVAVNPREPR